MITFCIYNFIKIMFLFDIFLYKYKEKHFMGRLARKDKLISKNNIYHVGWRGVNRFNVFENDEDKQKFLDILVYYTAKIGFKIYAYCIMSNHVHLLIKEENVSISKIMHKIGTSYASYFNRKYERSGSVFEKRFDSVAIESDMHFIMEIRYIHWNPCKAGIVHHVSAYKWSSFCEYTNRKKVSNLIETKYLFSIINLHKFLLISREEPQETSTTIEFDNFPSPSDNRVSDIIKKVAKINFIHEIQRFSRSFLSEIYISVKNLINTNTSQFSRITGLSKCFFISAKIK